MQCSSSSSSSSSGGSGSGSSSGSSKVETAVAEGGENSTSRQQQDPPLFTLLDPQLSRGEGDYDKDNVHLTPRGAKKLTKKLAAVVAGIAEALRAS